MVWAALWGPIGIAGLLYGGRLQSRLGGEPTPRPTADAVGIGSMVNVWVGDEFRLGTIESLRETDGVVETLVRHLDRNGAVTTTWVRP